jgi:hypothetical protein
MLKNINLKQKHEHLKYVNVQNIHKDFTCIMYIMYHIYLNARLSFFLNLVRKYVMLS